MNNKSNIWIKVSPHFLVSPAEGILIIALILCPRVTVIYWHRGNDVIPLGLPCLAYVLRVYGLSSLYWESYNVWCKGRPPPTWGIAHTWHDPSSLPAFSTPSIFWPQFNASLLYALYLLALVHCQPSLCPLSSCPSSLPAFSTPSTFWPQFTASLLYALYLLACSIASNGSALY